MCVRNNACTLYGGTSIYGPYWRDGFRVGLLYLRNGAHAHIPYAYIRMEGTLGRILGLGEKLVVLDGNMANDQLGNLAVVRKVTGQAKEVPPVLVVPPERKCHVCLRRFSNRPYILASNTGYCCSRKCVRDGGCALSSAATSADLKAAPLRVD